VAELRALAHPLRFRILELFAQEPRTTKKVAELLGQPPTRLYHHVAALERAGLIMLRETRQNRGAVEKWYEAVARQVGSTPRIDATPAGKRARRAVAMTVMEQSRRDVMAAMGRPGREPALLVRVVMVTPAAAIPKVRRRLYDAVKTIERDLGGDGEAEGPTKGSERWAVTLSFAPTSASAPDAQRSSRSSRSGSRRS
jgi:DNA-binding transcriptional ArsR family regulator